MPQHCCCCLSLRFGTLVLALIGAIYSIFVTVALIQFGTSNYMPPLFLLIPAYFVLSAFASIIGIIGVIRKNTFEILLFFCFAVLEFIIALIAVGRGLIEIWSFDPVAYCKNVTSPEDDPDGTKFEACLSMVRSNTIVIVAFMVIWVIIKGHFMSVIWAYRKELKQEKHEEAERLRRDRRSYGAA